jgi:hypothetical protein
MTCGCTQAPWNIEIFRDVRTGEFCGMRRYAGRVQLSPVIVCPSVYPVCVLLAAADLLEPSVRMRGFTPPYPPYLTKERLSTQEF